ncbi:MAG: class I SAM-dependent methyltransferase [Anaerolineae bacterium]|nr:class I SAM-dependent methyltransferase [Anaerolineae bacterium]
MSSTPPICDYEGSPYRTAFWNEERRYEDRADRLALQRLLPSRGQRLVEIGAGFGRLAPLYTGYDHVILLDYSSSLLREAQSRLGADRRVSYVVANLYHLPLADESLDTAVTVRVLHHVKDLPSALAEISRVLRRGGVYVTEYANKRNLKAILRYALGRQADNPFSAKPYEFAPLNIDYHPRLMERLLNGVGLVPDERLAVSTFRVGLVKRLVPAAVLAWLDRLLQRPTAPLRLAPSMFVRARRRSRLADADAVSSSPSP